MAVASAVLMLLGLTDSGATESQTGRGNSSSSSDRCTDAVNGEQGTRAGDDTWSLDVVDTKAGDGASASERGTLGSEHILRVLMMVVVLALVLVAMAVVVRSGPTGWSSCADGPRRRFRLILQLRLLLEKQLMGSSLPHCWQKRSGVQDPGSIRLPVLMHDMHNRFFLQ